MRFATCLLEIVFLLSLSQRASAYVHDFHYKRLQAVVSQLKLDAQEQKVANSAISDLMVEDRAIRKHQQDDDGTHGKQHKEALRKAITRIDGALDSDQETQFHKLLEKADLIHGKDKSAATQPAE
jgi:hypothetical protein